MPLLAHMDGWGLRHTPESKELCVRAKILEDRGPKLGSEFMEEPRAPPPEGAGIQGSAFSRLQSPFLRGFQDEQGSEIVQCVEPSLRACGHEMAAQAVFKLRPARIEAEKP